MLTAISVMGKVERQRIKPSLSKKRNSKNPGMLKTFKKPGSIRISEVIQPYKTNSNNYQQGHPCLLRGNSGSGAESDRQSSIDPLGNGLDGSELYKLMDLEDQGMNLVVVLLSSLLSGIAGVGISNWYHKKAEKRMHKLRLLEASR